MGLSARGHIVEAQDTHERLSFQSQWSGGREMITRERLYVAARRGEPARIEALLPHMPNHAAARPWTTRDSTLSGGATPH